MNYFLSEAREPIVDALDRLCVKDGKRHPFVVIDKVARPDVFVQFTVRQGVLLFDVPRLRIYLDPMLDARMGADAAIKSLVALGVFMDERVLIHEEEDHPRVKGIPFWKRIFA